MYESFMAPGDDLAPLLRDHDPALFHTGDWRRLLRLNEKHAAMARRSDDVPAPGPYLMRRIGDARTMRAACAALCQRGAKAAGPSHLRLEDLEDGETWSLCRAMATQVREGHYQPGRQWRVPIPKEGKPGQFRILTVQSTEDRVVGKAAQLILQPVIDPLFCPMSFGFRPHCGTLQTLATATQLAAAQQRGFFVKADVARAFDAIPHRPFLDACRQHLPDDVVDFISVMSNTHRMRGLRQGSPASPLLANIFFDHFVDRPWYRRHPETPLLRYADDLLLLTRSADEASARYESLAELARSGGTPLKGLGDDCICDIAGGERLEWLGFQIRWENGQFTFRIGSGAWDRLSQRLTKTHLLDDAPLRAVQVVCGWLAYLGPCYDHEDQPAVVNRVRTIAAKLEFDELPTVRELTARWQTAYRLWQKIRQHAAAVLPDRLQLLSRYSKGISLLPRLDCRGRKHGRPDIIGV